MLFRSVLENRARLRSQFLSNDIVRSVSEKSTSIRVVSVNLVFLSFALINVAYSKLHFSKLRDEKLLSFVKLVPVILHSLKCTSRREVSIFVRLKLHESKMQSSKFVLFNTIPEKSQLEKIQSSYSSPICVLLKSIFFIFSPIIIGLMLS